MIHEDPAWYQALTLAERLGLRRDTRSSSSSGATSSKAQRLLKSWKLQSPFQNQEWLLRRLALNGLDEPRFLELLDEPAQKLEEASPEAPPWLKWLSEAFLQRETFAPHLLGLSWQDSTSSFLPLIEPLLAKASEQLRRNAIAIASPDGPFDGPSVASLFVGPMLRRLGTIISQTAVLELFIANLQGSLEGETSDERFRSFTERLKDRSFSLDLLRQYPVLARIITTWLNQWVEASLEFLSHLAADWDLIRSTFTPAEDPGCLEEVSGGMGDRHRGGRTVLIAHFNSGFRLVYKPKSLAIDLHFGELVCWLNSKGAPGLRVPRVLNRGGYGWSEFVAASPCESRNKLELFYRRQGAFLALLYALRATDFHSENLIAVGEHPMLVDLESLFHSYSGNGGSNPLLSKAELAMTESVLRVGLLPQRTWTKDESGSIDLSGIGSEDNQISPWTVPLWENGGTDQMRLVRQKVKIGSTPNRPQLAGEVANPLEFSDALLEGFTTLYQLLLNHRDELLSDDGPLAQFASDQVRAIFRHTRFYATLLNESYHPDLLRDALERDRMFDRLWYGLDRDEAFAAIAIQLIPAEHKDLWYGDIPFFTTRVDSLDAWTSRGERIPGVFRTSGFDAVKQRLISMGDDDLRQQIWFIRGSLTSISMETEPRRKPYALRTAEVHSDEELREKLLVEALRIGERLGSLAMRDDGDDVSWIGLKIMGGRHWTLAPLGFDLYSGSPGIALFLAYLAELTGEVKHAHLAEAAMAGLLRREKRLNSGLKLIGAFEGWAGLLYAYQHLAAVWKQTEYLQRANDTVQRLIENADKDVALDLLSGSAGAIIVALGFYEATGSASALKAARMMGDRLLAMAQHVDHGVAWIVAVNPDRPLTGLSHGASGMAWALLALHEKSGDFRYRETALQALAFENSLFDRKAENWPDFRGVPTREKTSTTFMTAWCHGAPGIGLARLRMLRWLHSSDLARDIKAALRATRARGFGSNHCLCHGDLGNLELFQEASWVLNDPELRRETKVRTAQILASIKEHGWLSGVPQGVETPDLMSGLAGIGYGLLRLAAPSQVPSVLMLDPPHGPLPGTDREHEVRRFEERLLISSPGVRE